MGLHIFSAKEANITKRDGADAKISIKASNPHLTNCFGGTKRPKLIKNLNFHLGPASTDQLFLYKMSVMATGKRQRHNFPLMGGCGDG